MRERQQSGWRLPGRGVVIDLKSKTCVVIDNGIGVSFARRLVGEYGRVIYWASNMTQVLQKQLSAIGSGFPGLERAEDLPRIRMEFRQRKDDILFVFLCVGMAGLQEDLRDEGFAVFGAGDGEDLELCRWDARQLQGRVGLPVQKTKLVKGVRALRSYLKDNPDTVVKISKYRGLGETFATGLYPLIKTRIDVLEVDLGPLSEEQEFVVEHLIDTLKEVGIDDIEVDGLPHEIAFCGAEKKNAGYIMAAVPYADLPDEVRLVSEKLRPAFAAWKYRGFYSSEIRVDKKGVPNLIDSTCRAPSPPGELLQDIIVNLPMVLWEAAHGRVIPYVLKAKYGFQVALTSDFARKHPLAVKYPASIERNVKLYEVCRRDGLDWIIPGEDESSHIGYVTGFGDTIEEAMREGMANAKLVEGDQVEFKDDLCNSLIEVLKESARNNIHFGKSPIPDKIEI
jgi:hypothetical protein